MLRKLLANQADMKVAAKETRGQLSQITTSGMSRKRFRSGLPGAAGTTNHMWTVSKFKGDPLLTAAFGAAPAPSTHMNLFTVHGKEM